MSDRQKELLREFDELEQFGRRALHAGLGQQVVPLGRIRGQIVERRGGEGEQG